MEYTEEQKAVLNTYAKGQLMIRQNARVFERKMNLTQAQVEEREAAFLAERDETYRQQYLQDKAMVANQ